MMIAALLLASLTLAACGGSSGGKADLSPEPDLSSPNDLNGVPSTDLAFGDWGQVFQGERMTAALLDRLCHRCHIFEMNGESYRFRESMKTKKAKKSE